MSGSTGRRRSTPRTVAIVVLTVAVVLGIVVDGATDLALGVARDGLVAAVIVAVTAFLVADRSARR